MNKRVLVLSKYPRNGASSRLRTLQYLPFLKQQGFEFTVHNLFDDSYLETLYRKGTRSRWAIIGRYLRRLYSLLWVRQFDIVWIEKEIFPYFPAVAERLLSFLGVKYVVDYDDAIFHNYDLSENPLVKRFLSRKIDTVMRLSGCVLAGNDYLATRARESGARKIQILPTVVDHRRYAERHLRGSGKLTVGWIGSPSTQKYVVEVFPALKAAYLKMPFRLLLVGATGEVRHQLPGLDVDVEPWNENTEADLIASMDIGIMPLHDGPWERGKCGYKLIQYMASCVSVIASPVGVNREIVEGSSSGLLADNLNEWEHNLTRLLLSDDMRFRMGRSGKNMVEEKYSLQSQVPVLKSVLESVG